MLNQQVVPKAEPIFSSVFDVEKYFAKRPDRLVDYIETGVIKRVSVVGVHISQLANAVGIPLKYMDREFNRLPETFVSPENFDNIGAIINAGRQMFPSPKQWHQQ